jgi:hypothetical protein
MAEHPSTGDESADGVEIRHLPPDPLGRRAGGYSAQSRGPDGTGGPDDDGLPRVTADSDAAAAPDGDLGPIAPGPG